MEVKGKIVFIGDIINVAANFQKREVVIETNEQYPQKILVELHADRVDIIDPYELGEEVICGINLRGRVWTNQQGEDKYFNTIVCWNVRRE